MKILLIGANGVIGSAIHKQIQADNEVITAGRSSGDVQVDVMNVDSIKSMFEKTGTVDAVICASGLPITFKPLAEMRVQDYADSFNGKALAQIQLAVIAKDFITSDGSITLTSGLLTDHFIKAGSAATMVNAAIDGFVKASAFEMPNNIRINVVSPGLLEESVPVYGSFFPGFVPVQSERVAKAFVRSVMGIENGKVFSVL